MRKSQSDDRKKTQNFMNYANQVAMIGQHHLTNVHEYDHM